MADKSKRNLTIAGAAALILSVGAASSSLIGSDNSDMSIIANAPSESYTVATTSYTPREKTTAIERAAADAPAVVIPSATAKSTAYVTTKADRSAERSPEEKSDASDIISISAAVTDADAFIVYVSEAGKYHIISDCSGMKNSTPMDIESAQRAGHTPCGNCVEDAYVTTAATTQRASAPSVDVGITDVVYVSKTGKYHRRSDCSGMKSSTPMERSAAIAAGHDPCKKCY